MSEHKTRSYEARCLMQLLSSLVNKDGAPKWRRKVDWGGVYKLSDYHNVANDVYNVIMGTQDQDYGPWKKKFEDRFHSAAAGEDRYAEAVKEAVRELDKRKVHSMVINDFLMRAYYPRPEMRALDAVDILVEPGKKKEVEAALKALDFMESKERVEMGWSYYKIPGVHIHIIERMGFTNKKMQNFFETPVKHYPRMEGYKYIHETEPEEFYLYTIGLCGERYARGKLEVRDVLDFWYYYLETYQEQDWDYIDKNLEKMSLDKFGEGLVKLAAFWFGRMNFPAQLELLGEMEEYILTKGIRGRKESEKLLPLIKEVADFYKRDIKKERRQQQLKWLFPSMDYMSTLFPILMKHPKLIRICWVARIFRSWSYTTKNLMLDFVKLVSDKAIHIRRKFVLPKRKAKGNHYTVLHKWSEMREFNLEKIAGFLNRPKKKNT